MLQERTIHAIVGENGAGKSTIMRIVYGFYNADSGEILVDGKQVDIRTPHDAIKLGIGMVHQHFMLVDTMTVAENIILGAETGNAFDLDLEKANTQIKTLSEEVKAEHRSAGDDRRSVGRSAAARRAFESSLSQRRSAHTRRADRGAVAAGSRRVFRDPSPNEEQGKTIIIITHKLEEVLAISDEVTVMRDGKVVGNVKTSETNAQELARMIVGRDVFSR